ncbi:hypothetical protein BLNAU_12198 [Blattamonas nauphoetae]|uniref:Uncharacterized protein n=1 Tax=Blattamonas nauphoetae TaxID=2049346 RepID=A0ABQ9XNA7_9EUKA|nr:hypothetical protein BLNAU_12198 [Blattamonas nauphoetae]
MRHWLQRTSGERKDHFRIAHKFRSDSVLDASYVQQFGENEQLSVLTLLYRMVDAELVENADHAHHITIYGRPLPTDHPALSNPRYRLRSPPILRISPIVDLETGVEAMSPFSNVGTDIHGFLDILHNEVEEVNTRAMHFELTWGAHQQIFCGLRERFGQHSTVYILFGVLEEMEMYAWIKLQAICSLEESELMILETKRQIQNKDLSK